MHKGYFPPEVFAAGGVIVLVIINGQVNTAGSSGIVVVLIPQEAAYPRVRPNVAGIWHLVMSGISNEYHDGTLYASGPWEADVTLPKITPIGGTISTSWTNDEGKLNTLTGTITGNSIYFTLQTFETATPEASAFAEISLKEHQAWRSIV